MLSLPSLGFVPVGIDLLPSPTTHHVGSISDSNFISSVFAQHPSLTHVLHTATLHKPHIGSHSTQDFIETNIKGTQVLLDCVQKCPHLESFIFISTTSAFGAALTSKPDSPATWISESITPIPKNIYGATKCTAEDLCYLTHKSTHLPVLILRTSRFFPEADDDETKRDSMCDENLKVLELSHRRCDVADIVAACHCAMIHAKRVGFGRFVISATTPFHNDPPTLRLLNENPEQAVLQVCPNAVAVFAEKGWKFPARVDRVYDSRKAVEVLEWNPVYTFARAVECVSRGEEWRSALSIRVGKKGYHDVTTGVYTTR
ncbi:hypothetical protein HDU98_001640 [Podochytrium sp. JEL0797]|nr:hypothetical protein HDU98_001640 [Podochytrium sp. JEL0797]